MKLKEPTTKLKNLDIPPKQKALVVLFLMGAVSSLVLFFVLGSGVSFFTSVANNENFALDLSLIGSFTVCSFIATGIFNRYKSIGHDDQLPTSWTKNND